MKVKIEGITKKPEQKTKKSENIRTMVKKNPQKSSLSWSRMASEWKEYENEGARTMEQLKEGAQDIFPEL